MDFDGENSYSALTLNPSPTRGEGLQNSVFSLLPWWDAAQGPGLRGKVYITL